MEALAYVVDDISVAAITERHMKSSKVDCEVLEIPCYPLEGGSQMMTKQEAAESCFSHFVSKVATQIAMGSQRLSESCTLNLAFRR